MDRHVRKLGAHPPEPLRGGQNRQQADFAHPPCAHGLQRRAGRAPGGQHGVEHQRDAHGMPRREFLVVFHGIPRPLVPVQAEMPDLRLRQEIQDRIHHAQPRAENGHESDAIPDARGGRHREGRTHRPAPEREIAGGFHAEQGGQPLHRAAELLRRCAAVPEDGQMVRRQRVIQDHGVRDFHGHGMSPAPAARRIRRSVSRRSSWRTPCARGS